MSNYTGGGYQYSHMHQSLDAEDLEGQICDDLVDYNLIKVQSAEHH